MNGTSRGGPITAANAAPEVDAEDRYYNRNWPTRNGCKCQRRSFRVIGSQLPSHNDEVQQQRHGYPPVQLAPCYKDVCL
jgi:hypothetical protein